MPEPEDTTTTTDSPKFNFFPAKEMLKEKLNLQIEQLTQIAQVQVFEINKEVDALKNLIKVHYGVK